MIESIQRQLPLHLHQRTALVTVETARAILGKDSETILAMIDSGELRWAWDISVTGQLREIRIWARELMAPAPDLEMETVVNAVLGKDRDRVRSTELSTHIFLCSRPHVMRLLRSGELTGNTVRHTVWIDRDSLVRFFRRRLQGVSVSA